MRRNKKVPAKEPALAADAQVSRLRNGKDGTERKAAGRKNTGIAGRGWTAGPFARVLVLFVLALIVRIILNTLVHRAPTVVIDEGLYLNLAKSLAAGHGVAFRDQPVKYPYLLYPLLLTPVYLLQGLLGGDPFRWLQVFNTILMSTAVFPAYVFAKEFSGSEKVGFLTAAVTALMPDMLLGGYAMTECVIWPLSMWLLVFSRRMLAGQGDLRYGILTAVVTALLFWAKPGAVATGAVLLLVHLFRTIRRKESSLRDALLPAAVLLIMIAAMYGIYFLLGGTTSTLLGLYEKQTSEFRFPDLLVMAEGGLLGCFLFAFACAGVYALIPFAYAKDYQAGQRLYIYAFTAGLGALILGTAVFVVPYKWYEGIGRIPMHMRYMSMYVPAYFAFSMTAERPRRKTGRTIGILLLVFAVLSVFPGARAGFVDGHTTHIDSVTLSAFCRTARLDSDVTGWTLTILTALFALFLISSLPQEGWSAGMKTISAFVFAAVLLFGNVCGYVNANGYIDPSVLSDAREVDSIIGRETALGITQQYYDDVYTYWLESRLHSPMQQVTSDQIYLKTEETDGIYEPFVPMEQSPNVNNRETPDTDLLVLGMTIAEHLELSRDVAAVTTKNGHFTVARIVRGSRWVDTMMYGLNRNTVGEGPARLLRIFDTRRDINGYLYLHLQAEGTGTLTVAGQVLPLSDGAGSYDLAIPFDEFIPLKAEGEVRILSYSTKTAEQ